MVFSRALCGRPANTTDVQDEKEKFLVLGEKPVGRLLFQYALPAIVAMAASSVYNIIDGIFIGQGVGPAAIMGLALTMPVMSLTGAFGAMVGVGGSTLMSVRLGQKDYEAANRILGNVLVMNVVMGLSLQVVLQLMLRPVLRFFGASDVTIGPAYDFMTVILVGNVVTHLYLGLNALLRSTNRPEKAMHATIGTVVVNCLLAPLFIFVLGWGIRGAAAATVTAQLLMLLWQIRLFSRKDDLIRIQRKHLHLDPKIVRQSLSIGLSPFLINLCACIVTVLMTRSLAAYGGDYSVGAYGIANRLLMLVVLVVIGLNQGMQPIAGYNYGAQKYDRVIEVLRWALIFGTAITTLGFLVAMFWAEPCAALFASDSPELIAMSAHAMRILSLTFPVVGLCIVATAFFQSLGKPGTAIFLSLTRQLIFIVPALFVLPRLLPDAVEGVWWSYPVSDALAFLLAAVMLWRQVRDFKLKTDTKSQKAHVSPE